MNKPITYRILFSIGLGSLLFIFLTAKWLVTANYSGEANCNFILSGFPLPYMVDWGIISHFGNSGDTAISFMNLSVDILFYVALTFAITFIRKKVFSQPTTAMKTISVLLSVAGIAFCSYYLRAVTTFGDLHPWFENGYQIKAVQFMDDDELTEKLK